VITGREFRLFLESWIRVAQASTVSSWIKQHACQRGLGQTDVEPVLFENIIERRHKVLSLAAESTLTQEHDSLTAEAKHLLLLMTFRMVTPVVS
jgi:hypothetical protein